MQLHGFLSRERRWPRKAISYPSDTVNSIDAKSLPYPDLSRLFKLPYTVTDNPNTVIEPTAACNLACPGCYRRSDQKGRRHAVMTLGDMKRYVDRSLELRNYGILSFLGGEPLMHPDLDAAIAYALEKGLGVGVYTNGLLLTKERAQSLKDMGVSYIYAHIDRHQGRGVGEDQVVRLRQSFCDMFRKIPGILFGFGLMINEEDLRNFDETAAFCRKNSDVISFVNLALLGPNYKDPDGWAAGVAKCDAFQRRACALIAEKFGFVWSCYLAGSILPDTPGKLMNYSFYQQGRCLGSVSPKAVKRVTTRARKEWKKYPYGALGHKDLLEKMTNLPGKVEGVPIHLQMINISLSPLAVSRDSTLHVNRCEPCTDAVLYKDHFIPMCLLEYVKAMNYDSGGPITMGRLEGVGDCYL